MVELVRVNEWLTEPETYNPLLRLIDEINKEEAVNNWIHSTNQLKQKQKIKLLFLFSSIGFMKSIEGIKNYYNSKLTRKVYRQ